MNDINELVRLSRYAGMRVDLTQAGGGNTSVQCANGDMLIKASGYLLSDLNESQGMVAVNRQQINDVMDDPKAHEKADSDSLKRAKDKWAADQVQQAVVDGSTLRPSIETFLHVLFHKFTLHTHPIAVNTFTVTSDWQEKLKKLFPQALYVSYATPGLMLALVLKEALAHYVDQHKQFPQVIFLQNHGLIVSADTVDDVIEINEKVITLCEQEAGLDLSRYHHTNNIAGLIDQCDGEGRLAYLSEDALINECVGNDIINKHPWSPDGYVFCGLTPLYLSDLSSIDKIDAYQQKYRAWPKVIIYQDLLYILAPSLRKAREAEDVLKAQLIVAKHQDKTSSLSVEEFNYLGNWDAEKYRETL